MRVGNQMERALLEAEFSVDNLLGDINGDGGIDFADFFDTFC